MKFCVLGSGSKGNCTLVASQGKALLIDAGFSGVEIERRLRAIGFGPEAVRGILITHEHGDHVRGAGIFSRRHKVPVFANAATMEAAGKALENLHEHHLFTTGRGFSFSGFSIHPFAVSHDTADPVGFRIESRGRSFGYCTDTGTVSRLIHYHLSSCHGLVLECNHDLEMLRNGHYPPAIQQRIRSGNGHLANPQALEVLESLLHDSLRHVVLAHISESNNCYRLVEQSVADFMKNQPHRVEFSIAFQGKVGRLVSLE